MKQSILNLKRAAMQLAALTLVITSCQKTATMPESAIVSEANARQACIPCYSNIPIILKVPDGNKLASQAYAKGVQIYQVQRSTTDPSAIKWVLVGPSATLYANPNYTNKVGTHYAGPTWEFTKGFNKGEKTVAKKLQEAPGDATAIPWLLLQAVDSLSSNKNKVTYIQRVCTVGGLAPATGADEAHLGQLDSIPYTAIYLFYKSEQ